MNKNIVYVLLIVMTLSGIASAGYCDAPNGNGQSCISTAITTPGIYIYGPNGPVLMVGAYQQQNAVFDVDNNYLGTVVGVNIYNDGANVGYIAS